MRMHESMSRYRALAGNNHENHISANSPSIRTKARATTLYRLDLADQRSYVEMKTKINCPQKITNVLSNQFDDMLSK